MSTVKLRIGPADNGRRMTLEEFREAEEEEGYRYELARGVLKVVQVPNDPHGQVVDNLHNAVTVYRHQHPGMIRRVGGGGEFRLWVHEKGSGRNPDLAIVFQGAPKDERGRRRRAWVAEVVSKRGENNDYVQSARITSSSASANTGSSIPSGASDRTDPPGRASRSGVVGASLHRR